ncbi:hypothetical protein AYI68_g8360 [Smittium mucronatum]|uniref:Transcription factor domain-containing protein n=1 Tax=Smittium mucronatum TaxID=133383 RepID=A0A1R0GL46_9FUNG|nr:hypothetical protein AYI68_g8360 [Smittium mucronatum]
MIPIRLPELLYKLKNNLLPKYFVYSLLAAGGEILEPSSAPSSQRVDKIFAKAALKSIRFSSDSNNLYLLWASLLLSAYYWKFIHPEENELILRFQKLFVLKSKIYRIDSVCKYKQLKSTDESEFARRVWWVYFIITKCNYIYRSGFPTFINDDIVVKLPSNDFIWRYGGSVPELDEDLLALNHHANSGKGLPSDFFHLLVMTYTLFSKVAEFLNIRWHNNPPSQKSISYKYYFYSQKIVTLESFLSKRFAHFDMMNISTIYKYSKDFTLIRNTETWNLFYITKQLLNSIKILLFQSDLVRLPNFQIEPEIIRSSKLKCIKAALDVAKLYRLKCKHIPIEYWSTTVTPWKLYSAIILINYNFISLPSNSRYNPSNLDAEAYETFIKNISLSSKNSEVAQTIHSFILHLYSLKSRRFIMHKSDNHLLDLMKPYSTSEYDLYPWLVPRYTTFIKFNCCLLSNYTSIDIKEYLFSNSPPFKIKTVTPPKMPLSVPIGNEIFKINPFMHKSLKTFESNPKNFSRFSGEVTSYCKQKDCKKSGCHSHLSKSNKPRKAIPLEKIVSGNQFSH